MRWRATAARRSATTSSATPKTVSDLLEVLLLQKEAGLLHGTLDDAARHSDLIVVPLFETIDDLRNAAPHHARVLRAARHAGDWCGAAAPSRT